MVRVSTSLRSRIPSCLILISALVLMGLGCGSGPSATDEPVVKLVYQDWRADWLADLAPQMLEEFHAQHPNIRVFYNPDPETRLSSTMLAEMKDGVAADVFQGCCSEIPIWAQAGFVLDLRPYVEADMD